MNTDRSTEPIRLLGIVGSLRGKSLNAALMAEAVRLAPSGMTIDVFDGLGDLPLFNHDLTPEPNAVRDLKEHITASDAILIATPEYNFGIPGVLKNALDWASTPPGRGPMVGVPVAMMGASPGMLGTARAQQQLRATLTFTRNPVVPSPEVLVAFATDKFDERGRLTDEFTERLVVRLLDALTDLVHRHR